MPVIQRMRSAWNAFRQGQDTASLELDYPNYGATSYATSSPSRTKLGYFNERSIISSIYTRISIDVASVVFRHIKLDNLGRYSENVDSELNMCLNWESNLDQGPRSFRQDIAMTLFDKGVAAIVPVDTTVDPTTGQIVDIFTLRVGEITDWYASLIKANVYNEATGKRQSIVLEKRKTAIVENPLYSVMNEPNSTLQRLIRKLGLLDAIDEQSGSGKLDLIIQLPYAVKSESRKIQANQRRTEMELQLKDSKYGVAYADATEKITQLNRPAENNLLGQIEFLTKMLYAQLGITEEVMNGTADEAAMRNYYNRTIEPIADAMAEAMQRAFLGRAGASRLEKIDYFTNPFKFIPATVFADMADKLTRNEIATGNEIRGFIGIPPSSDPKADELRNSNMPRSATDLQPPVA